MCPALGVTGQGHYAWRRRGPSARDLRDAELARPIPEVYESSRGSYGAPRVHMELRRRGFRTSRVNVNPSFIGRNHSVRGIGLVVPALPCARGNPWLRPWLFAGRFQDIIRTLSGHVLIKRDMSR